MGTAETNLLVSCIMPTRGRQELARQAVECFHAQDYQLKELVILDDKDLPSFPDGIDALTIHYHRADRRRGIADKRNRLCKLAVGQLIAHWDSDDWNHPNRLSHQVALMEEFGKSVAAYRTLLFHGPEPDHVTRYIGALNYGIGTSLMYSREWWQRNPFSERLKIGEDSRMVGAASDAKQLISVEGECYIVARVHADNTAKKRVNEKEYRRMTLADLPEGYPR